MGENGTRDYHHKNQISVCVMKCMQEGSEFIEHFLSICSCSELYFICINLYNLHNSSVK